MRMEHVVQHTSDLGGVTHQDHSRPRIAAMRLVMMVAAAFILAACREYDSGSSITDPTVITAVAPSLVGLWKGPLSGSGGNGVVTMRLHADSTMVADNENPNYTR